VERQERTVNYGPPTVESKRSPATPRLTSRRHALTPPFHRKSAFSVPALSVPAPGRRKSPAERFDSGLLNVSTGCFGTSSQACVNNGIPAFAYAHGLAIPLLTSRPTWARTSPSTSISSPPRALDIISRTTTILASHRRRAHSLANRRLNGLRRFGATCRFVQQSTGYFNAARTKTIPSAMRIRPSSLTRTSPYSRADGWDAQF